MIPRSVWGAMQNIRQDWPRTEEGGVALTPEYYLPAPPGCGSAGRDPSGPSRGGGESQGDRTADHAAGLGEVTRRGGVRGRRDISEEHGLRVRSVHQNGRKSRQTPRVDVVSFQVSLGSLNRSFIRSRTGVNGREQGIPENFSFSL